MRKIVEAVISIFFLLCLAFICLLDRAGIVKLHPQKITGEVLK